jgi:dihydrodipicolinate synthase/N-acetylneuraminate lyase
MKNVRGIVTVLNTPFAKDDTIDFAGLRINVANALDAGVAGFLVPAMASEVDHLSRQEKREIVRLVVAESGGRAVVFGGASAPSQQARVELAREFVELGCDGILVQIDAATDPGTVERDLVEIAELNPRILMLQDWDSTGDGIPIQTIVRLFERIERFNWLKIEVRDAGPKYSQVLKQTEGQLRVAGGWAVTQMIDGLERGVHAFMPTAMHDIYVQIYQRHCQRDVAGAKHLFDQIKPVLDFSNQSLDISIRFFKRMLHAQGVYATANVRIGGSPFSAEQERIADRLIRDVTELQYQLSGPTRS